MDLTELERNAYDLRHSTDPPMTWREVGSQLGIMPVTARRRSEKGEDKLRSPDRVSGVAAANRAKAIEHTDPERAAEAIDALTNPLSDSLTVAGEVCGMPGDTIKKLADRLVHDYSPLYEDVKLLKVGVLRKAFERLAIAAVEAITPEKLEKLDAYKLTLVGAISTDKVQLLSGQPTQHMSIEVRHSLHEMMPALMHEATRRGLLKEVNPETGRAYLSDPADDPVRARFERDNKDILDIEVLP